MIIPARNCSTNNSRLPVNQPVDNFMATLCADGDLKAWFWRVLDTPGNPIPWCKWTHGHGTMGCVDSCAQISRDPCMDLWPDYLIEADVLQLECKFSRSVNCCVLSSKNSYSGIDLHGLFISSTWFCPPCFYSSSFPCSCCFVLVSILRQTSSRSFCAYLAYIQPFHHPLDLILGKMWGDRFTSYICIVSTSIQSWIVWCACVCLFFGITLLCPFFPQSQAYCTLPKIVYQADGWNVGDPGCWMRSFKRWCLVKMWSTNRDPCLIRIGGTPWLEYSGNM